MCSGSTSFGAWIDIDHTGEMKFTRFTAATYQGKYEKPRQAPPINGGWY